MSDRSQAAHRKVLNAVKRGELKPQPCEVCGEVKAMAHHDDYDKPLEVRWLCHSHHALHHKQDMSQITGSVVYMPQCTCLRCGHVWIGRVVGVEPTTCAKCRSPYRS